MAITLKYNKSNLSHLALQEIAGTQQEQFPEMLLEVFDNLNQGIIVTNRNGRVIVFNKIAQQMMGYSAEEVIGRHSLWDFCDECGQPPLFRESLMNSRSFPDEEVEMNGKDGTTLGVKVTPLYGHQRGELQGALATIRDLAETRARENQQKSLVRLASIGQLVSAIAHEINNPLQSIRTILELSQNPRKSATQRQEYLETADTEIGRIAHIISQMRNFYRPNPVSKSLTDVNATVLDALSLLEKPLSEAGVEVETRLAPKLPAVPLVDYQLEQVVLNLVLNALETMPKGGRLEVVTSRTQNGVSIIFWDNAPRAYTQTGKSSETIFDPFEGSRGSLSIGLSVSHEIIKEMGGRFDIDISDGTKLTVHLPA